MTARTAELAGPPGSDAIEKIFTDYFTSQGLASAPTEFSGRSDYGPFIAVGIPAGGLFSGAEGIKTAEEAAIYGGTAGEAYDPCYHQACDTINNLSTKALFEMGDAAAHAVWTLAKSKSGLYPDGSRGQGRRPRSLRWSCLGRVMPRSADRDLIKGPEAIAARSPLVVEQLERSSPTFGSVGVPVAYGVGTTIRTRSEGDHDRRRASRRAGGPGSLRGAGVPAADSRRRSSAPAGRDVGHLRHRQAHLPRRDQAVRRHAGRDRHSVPDHPGPRECRRRRGDHPDGRGADRVLRTPARRGRPDHHVPGRRLWPLLPLHPRDGLRLVRQLPCYGNSFTSAEPPHLLGGWAGVSSTCGPTPSSTRCPMGCRLGWPCSPS